MLRIVEVMARCLFGISELQQWWSEWRTRQNPVAFWIAVITAMGLVVVALVVAHSAWQNLIAPTVKDPSSGHGAAQHEYSADAPR